MIRLTFQSEQPYFHLCLPSFPLDSEGFTSQKANTTQRWERCHRSVLFLLGWPAVCQYTVTLDTLFMSGFSSVHKRVHDVHFQAGVHSIIAVSSW